jgi:hypothetical protein
LVHFVFIWYIFSSFGIMHQEKSGSPENGFGRILGYIFTNSSGHPAHGLNEYATFASAAAAPAEQGDQIGRIFAQSGDRLLWPVY